MRVTKLREESLPRDVRDYVNEVRRERNQANNTVRLLKVELEKAERRTRDVDRELAAARRRIAELESQ